MASIAKYTRNQVAVQLGHGMRTNNTNAQHIHKSHIHENYILSPQRDIHPYDYYLQKREELYIYNRADVKEMIEVVVTQPKDSTDERAFFQATFDYLNNKFGGKNGEYTLLCVVHKDEDNVVLNEGRGHLHYYAIPTEEDKKKHKHSGRKIGSGKLLSRQVYRNFHVDFAKYLRERGVDGTVYSGITAKQGGNIPVHQLKEREREVVYEW